MKWFKIDGYEWDVRVLAVEETFTILYSENTCRSTSAGARMVLDPLGTFYGHKVTVARKAKAFTEFDDLYEYLSAPRTEGVFVEIVHGQTTLTYEAYVSSGTKKVLRIDENTEKVFYDAFDITFIPMEAQIVS